MNEHPLTQGQRQVLRDLTRLVAERSRAEAKAETEFKSRTESALQEFQETRGHIAAEFESESAAADREHQEAVQTLPAVCEAEIAAAAAERDHALQKIPAKLAEAQEEAEKKYTETRWTSVAMFEAKEKAAKDPLLDVQKRMALVRERMEATRTEAAQLLRRWKQRGAEARAARKSKKSKRSAERPDRELGASLAQAEEDLKELQELRLPRFFQGIRPVWLLLALWGIFSLAGFLVFPSGLAGGRYHWMAVSTAAALVLELAIVMLLYVMAREKVLTIHQPMCDTLAEAEAAIQRVLQEAEKKHEGELAKLEERRKKRDADLQQLDEKYEQLQASLKERHDQALREVKGKFPKLRDAAEKRRDHELKKAAALFQERVAAMRERQETELRQVEEKHRRLTEEANKAYEQARKALTTAWKQGLAQAQTTIAEINRATGQMFPPWAHPCWKQWKSPRGTPPVLRFGEHTIDLGSLPGGSAPAAWFQGGATPRFSLPALLSFPERCSMLFQSQDAPRAEAVKALQAMMLRFLTSLPAGKVRLTIIDPVGLGENFGAFMHLTDYDEALVNSRIWTEARHIEQRLTDLAAHMENVIQTYLRNQFKSIEEYNAQAGEVAEPYRILVVANFPVNFTPEAARRLVSIASSGASCGVYTLVSVDRKQPLPDGFNMVDLEGPSVCLTADEQSFRAQDKDFKPYPLKLDGPPAPEQVTALLRQVGEAARAANRVEVPFEFIMPRPEDWWKSDSRPGIDIPLGQSGANKRQHLRLGKGTAHHVLLAGKTGSGKSTLLHALITNLALHYSPQEIELYLVDFKKGVEFKTYATHELPHAKVVAIESEREFGLSVLQRLDAELKERGERFRRKGVQNLTDFRAGAKKQDDKQWWQAGATPDGEPCPRILLIVDEFQEFFTEDDKIAQEAALLLDRLVRQGRAFGLHILLGSQTLGGAYTLARATIDQMAVRIALQCSETDANLILSKDNSAARLLSRPGEAIYNDANGLVEGNEIFQVVWLPDQKREELLRKLHDLARKHNQLARGQLIFEGNAPADVRNNELLQEMLRSPTRPAVTRAGSAWLGEALAIKGPTAAVFQRQTGSNLILVGQQDEPALGILTTALIGLAAQMPPEKQAGAFHVLDGTPVDSPQAGYWARVCGSLPHGARVGSWRETAAVVGEVAAEVDRRQKSNDTEAPPVFLFIYGLHRFRDLRRQEEDFGFSRRGEDQPLPPSKHLETILREGPAFGVHTLAWCDGLNNLTRAFDRQTLREFALRVLFQMNANDSSTLVDSPVASRLGVHRALYFNEDLGQPEKFRPYGLPSAAWLEEVKQMLGKKRIAGRASASV